MHFDNTQGCNRPPQTDEERENERLYKSLVDPHPGYLPWYGSVALGVFSAAFTVYAYYSITAAERGGQAAELPHAVRAIYNILGKWGVVGLFATISIFTTGLGMYEGIFPDKAK